MDKGYLSTVIKSDAHSLLALVLVLEFTPAVHVVDPAGTDDHERVVVEIVLYLTAQLFRLAVREVSFEFNSNCIVDCDVCVALSTLGRNDVLTIPTNISCEGVIATCFIQLLIKEVL